MSKKTCDDAVERLYPYLDNEISTIQRMKVRWHLRRCPPCEGAYHFEEKLKLVIHDRLHEDCPEEVLDRLRRMVRDQIPDR